MWFYYDVNLTEYEFHRMCFSQNVYFTNCEFLRMSISPNAIFTEIESIRICIYQNYFLIFHLNLPNKVTVILRPMNYFHRATILSSTSKIAGKIGSDFNRTITPHFSISASFHWFSPRVSKLLDLHSFVFSCPYRHYSFLILFSRHNRRKQFSQTHSVANGAQ